MAAGSLSCLLMACPLPGRADLRQKYTEEHPLIILCDWDFPPYEFMGDGARPEGFNVDLLTMILTARNIPFTIEMHDWPTALERFATHQADIIIDHTEDYGGKDVYISKLPIHYYQLKALCRNNATSLDKMSAQKKRGVIAVKDKDYGMCYLRTHPYTSMNMVTRSPKAAIVGVADGQYDYFVWGEEPMKWKLKILHVDSLRMDSISIPTGKIHLIGYDPELVEYFDDQYARLRQQGELQLLTDKWFYPERRHNNLPVTAILVVLAFAILGVVIFLLARLIRYRVRTAMEHSKDLNNMMKQALSFSDSMVIVHDIRENRVTNEYGNLLPDGGITTEELAQRLHPDDRADYLNSVTQLKEGKLVAGEVYCRMNVGSDDAPKWVYLQGMTASESEQNQPRFIINLLKNVTQEREEERHDNELAARFFHLFDSNLIAMSFYDPTGKLVNLNQQMRELCNINETNAYYFRDTNLFETEMFRGAIKPGLDSELYVCQHMYYPEMNIDKYIELKILPHFDESHHLIYYVVSAIDISFVRDMHLELMHYEQQLQKAGADINNYEQQLHYLLNNCEMFVWQFDLSTRMITFSRSLKQVEFSMSRDEYVQGMVAEEREEADRNLMQMIMTGSPFNAIHHFNHTPANPQPCWYALNGLPFFSAEGKMIGYFGVCRDITKLMEVQEQLRHETQRAVDSGRQKSAFLANMTHEIRTPLNAIVGFSDLLPMIESAEEKQEFIRIIRNNCDMLLRLINDILEASNMDSRPLTIEPDDVDFAQAFDDICQTLAQRVQDPNVAFIKDNPYTTLPTRLDKGRMQQVLTNFVTNAVKNTREGHIKVGYRCTPLSEALSVKTEQLAAAIPSTEGLLIYCEDTGIGIPKEKQDAVFGRFVKLDEFVQGTGLGLSICKSIAERSNGAIGVISDGPGHGSTFWIWIPCPLPKN